MAAANGMWKDVDVERLIDRLELRLEQYRLHAESLSLLSRDREGADALVKRIEARLLGLRNWRSRHPPPQIGSASTKDDAKSRRSP